MQWKAGDPGGSRTPNPQFRRLMLYPVELRGRGAKLEMESSYARRSTDSPFDFAQGGLRRLSLHDFPKKNWGGKRESNPQPSEPQSGALPVELFPPQEIHYSNTASLHSEIDAHAELRGEGDAHGCARAEEVSESSGGDRQLLEARDRHRRRAGR